MPFLFMVEWYSIVCLDRPCFLHPLMDIRVVPTFWLLWIRWLRTFTYNVWTYVFIIFAHLPRIIGSCDNSTVNFTRNCRTIVRRLWATLCLTLYSALYNISRHSILETALWGRLLWWASYPGSGNWGTERLNNLHEVTQPAS